MDMWVGARSAGTARVWSGVVYSAYVSWRTGCYFTRCALIRTDDRLLHMQFGVKQRIFK